MSKFKAPKSVITVDGIELVGYRTESSQWVMSMTTLANVLNLQPRSIFDFLKSEWLKSRLGMASESSPVKVSVEGSNKPIVAIDTELAALFFRFQDSRNSNPVAQKLVDALMSQALNIRFEGTLTPDLSYREVESKALSIIEARKIQLELNAQNLFQSWMLAKRFSPSKVHDYLTSKVVGRTAKESRALLQTVPGIPTVGLNHWTTEEVDQMELITQIKLFCASSYPKSRQGWSYQTYIDDAIDQLTELI